MQKTKTFTFSCFLLALPQLVQAQILFTRVVNNGTVSPTYFLNTTCSLTEAGVRILTTGQSIQFPRPQLRALVYTDAVPNLELAYSLKETAQLAPLQNAVGPIGGGRSTYTAQASEIGESETVLLVSSGNVPIQYRDSQAAKKLIAWMDVNCN